MNSLPAAPAAPGLRTLEGPLRGPDRARGGSDALLCLYPGGKNRRSFKQKCLEALDKSRNFQNIL